MAEDLTLPENNEKRDERSVIEQQPEMSKHEKAVLDKQKAFEFKEKENKAVAEQEEKKELLKSKLFQWIIIILVLILLGGLYYWLVW